MKRADLLAKLDIGMTIKKLRESKGLSQEQLAKDICDRTNITKLENGHSKVPSLSFVLSICEKLDMTMDEFLNYAFVNSYKLDKKEILDLLINNNIKAIKAYINDLNIESLSLLDIKYYNLLLAKVQMDNNDHLNAYALLTELITYNENDYISVFAMHELYKNEMLDKNAYLDIYSRPFLDKLKDKKENELYLYYINDLLQISINNNDIDMSKYLLDLELHFINNHDLYKYLNVYYRNKINIYRDEYNSIHDIEHKLLPIKNNTITN